MKEFSRFLQAISRVNGLDGGLNIDWLFHCGMLFRTRDKWWGDFRFRHAVHEGIDITYYRTHPDKLNVFDETIKVPAMDDGIVLNICGDFLGQTLVVEQKKPTASSGQILFVYSHIIPENHLKQGLRIHKDTDIATVCDTHKNPQLPPHLHFSCFEVLEQVPANHLNWTLFSDSNRVNMIHPVFL